ncbi:hypothetical protein SDC9_190058 [bioreactor metagenome]|uniref:Uncharacterized protein n=1 Tax=bioreactor metagenome TaxID=1076179 RepID=A0A645HTX7_9ZZZZ
MRRPRLDLLAQANRHYNPLSWRGIEHAEDTGLTVLVQRTDDVVSVEAPPQFARCAADPLNRALDIDRNDLTA